MRRILIKCSGGKKRKDGKSHWQIRWEDSGGYLFALQLGLMTFKEARQANREFSAWKKKWRAQ